MHHRYKHVVTVRRSPIAMIYVIIVFHLKCTIYLKSLCNHSCVHMSFLITLLITSTLFIYSPFRDQEYIQTTNTPYHLKYCINVDVYHIKRNIYIYIYINLLKGLRKKDIFDLRNCSSMNQRSSPNIKKYTRFSNF